MNSQPTDSYAVDPVGVIQQAMCLDPGSEIVIPCHTYREMERIRAACYREVKKLSSTHPALARRIDVARKTEQNTFKVIISITPPIEKAYIITPTGERAPLSGSFASDPELERICTMMEEDGASDKDIQKYREEYLKETGRVNETNTEGTFDDPSDS